MPWTLIDGVPAAFGLVGKPFTEPALLAAAAACETARGPLPAPSYESS